MVALVSVVGLCLACWFWVSWVGFLGFAFLGFRVFGFRCLVSGFVVFEVWVRVIVVLTSYVLSFGLQVAWSLVL